MAKLKTIDAIRTSTQAIKKYVDNAISSMLYKDPTAEREYIFDLNKRAEYEAITSDHLRGDFKIAESNDLPAFNEIENYKCIITYVSPEYGEVTSEATIIDMGSVGYSLYFENGDPIAIYSVYVLYKNWAPGPGYDYTPGLWVRCTGIDELEYHKSIKFIKKDADDTEPQTLSEAIYETKEAIAITQSEFDSIVSDLFGFKKEMFVFEEYQSFDFPGEEPKDAKRIYCNIYYTDGTMEEKDMEYNKWGEGEREYSYDLVVSPSWGTCGVYIDYQEYKQTWSIYMDCGGVIYIWPEEITKIEVIIEL